MRNKAIKLFLLTALAAVFAAFGLFACGEKNGGKKDPPKDPVVTYAVSFESNGGTAQDGMVYSSDGAPLVLPVPEYYGFDFAGWYGNAELSGGAADAAAFVPSSDTVLYAKWERAVYLYTYYGEDNFKHKRVSYRTGDVIDVAELTPPEPYIADGVTCPFIGWRYEDGSVPGATITVGEEHIVLLAMYDKTGVPAKHYYKTNADGSVTATGNLAWVQTLAESAVGVYSAEVAFTKGTGGGAGLAFRMKLSGNDYPYQDNGTDYLSAVIIPASGRLQVATVTDGAFAHMAGSVVAFEAMPAAWQRKYNEATGDIKAVLTVADYGDRFEIYIDGEKTFTFADAAVLAKYTGTGFGIRCSSAGSDFAEFSHRGAVTVSFESNGGSVCDAVEWLYGDIELPVSEKNGVVLDGWYYDKALKNKADPGDFKAASDITLYAKWTDDFTVVHIETFGGTKIEDVNYTGGKLILPEPTRENSFFTGWFYDEACTRAVDVGAPIIEEETTIYAGWRMPLAYITDNGDGTYTTQGKSTLAVNGVANGICGEVEMDLSFPKGIGGAVGIAFRVTAAGDYSWEGNSMYLLAQILPGTGVLQVGKIKSGFAHLIGGPVPMAKLPAAWQAKYNAAAAESEINVTLKVVYLEDGFTVYIDGDLAYTSAAADAEIISSITGKGYGLRSSANAKPSTYGVRCTDIYKTELIVDGDTFDTLYLKQGEIITVTVTDSEPATDAFGAYLMRFDGWYTQETGGEKTEVGGKNAAGKLYAHFERIALHTVTYDGNNGEGVFTTQYYENGGKLVLPAETPIKESTSVGGVNKGYVFDRWQIGGEDIPGDYTVTANITVSAVYTERNAYIVRYVTGADGLTVDDRIVPENEAAELPELTRDGYLLEGWYTENSFIYKYTDGAVTGALTLYAKWVESVTVTFVSDGTTVSTQVIYKGAVSVLPEDRTKAPVTAQNKNVHTNTFKGWYAGETKVTATTVFDADTTVAALFDEEISRNGVILEYNADGDVTGAVFGNKWVPSSQGVCLPDISIREGYYEYTLNMKKSSPGINVRMAFLMSEAGNVSQTGTGQQGNMWVNFASATGGLIFGRKVKGNTNNTFELPYVAIKSCAYKTKYSAYAVGDVMSLRFRIEIGQGKYKFYIEDCLLGVYGDADYTGETLYGKVLDETTVSTAGQGAGIETFQSWMENPEGLGIGFILWQSLDPVGGKVEFTDIRYGETQSRSARQTNADAPNEIAYTAGKENEYEER